MASFDAPGLTLTSLLRHQPFAFEAREYIRALIVGKPVKFNVTSSVSSATPPLEFGNVVYTTPAGEEIDVGLAVVKAGWAKLREARNNSAASAGAEEAGTRRQVLSEAQEEARVMARGLWTTKDATERHVNFMMPDDPAAFLARHKGKPIDAIIENVMNGTNVRARLLLSPTQHQFVSVAIAGVRAPRAGDDGEEFGNEARFFTESRLLQRQIKITLLFLPTPPVTPTAFNPNGHASAPTPAPVATSILGTVHHPAGNIAALLVASGLAKPVDYHAGFLAQSPTPTMMPELRKAEAEAKAARRCLWKDLPAPTQQSQAAAAQKAKDSKFDGVVTRVWGADQLSVLRADGKEIRLQLSSTRQPRSDFAAFA